MSEYFPKIAEDAIIKFNSTENFNEKHEIYLTIIKSAFEQLVDNLILVYRFSTCGHQDFESLKNDCVSYLYERIPRYDPSTNSRAFSYFNVVAKNYLMNLQNKANNSNNKNVEYDHNLVIQNDTCLSSEDKMIVCEEDIEHDKIAPAMVKELEFWKKKYTKPREVAVLNAIIYLFKNIDKIDIFNKKSIYLYLREITGLKTKELLIQLKKFQRSYAYYKKHKEKPWD